mmetsp:Transcript_120503/g.213142  ORF Transcript_120503/g.213142 Transcript_120503/m.213142 type:complete len:278 (+) Transcript_120503:122-955(+)
MSSTQSHLSTNDGVLVISLLYLSIDMQYEWHEFVMCHWPIHRWLLVSYAMIILFRLMHVLGSMHAAADAGDFLLNLRHKATLPRMLMSLTWLCVLPFFTAWTAMGAYWLWDSKRRDGRCLPAGIPLYFIITWQVLSAAWVIIHATLGIIAWLLERRLRRAEGNLREIEDADVVARWGQVSQLSGYTALTGAAQAGLTPLEISNLPVTSATTSSEESECPICLLEINQGDKVRQLAICGHTFHRSCIDLWLLRRADCPLCKRDVRGSYNECHQDEVNV